MTNKRKHSNSNKYDNLSKFINLQLTKLNIQLIIRKYLKVKLNLFK